MAGMKISLWNQLKLRRYKRGELKQRKSNLSCFELYLLCENEFIGIIILNNWGF